MRDLSEFAHHSAKPERERLYRALAMILGRGYTLTTPEVQEIMPHYGYKANQMSAASIFMGNHKTKKALGKLGVELVDELYFKRLIYRDGSLPVAETDLRQTYAAIDKKHAEIVKKRRGGKPTLPEVPLTELTDIVSQVSSGYVGPAYLVPSPDIVSAAMGRTKSVVYGDKTFEERLEEATGLKVIHNGIVLGLEEELSAPHPSPSTIDNMKATADRIANTGAGQRTKKNISNWIAGNVTPVAAAGFEITEPPEYYG